MSASFMGLASRNLEVRAEVPRKMICSLLESLREETQPLTPAVKLLLQAAFVNYFSLSPVLAQTHVDVGGCDIMLGEKQRWRQETQRFIGGILELIKYSRSLLSLCRLEYHFSSLA